MVQTDLIAQIGRVTVGHTQALMIRLREVHRDGDQWLTEGIRGVSGLYFDGEVIDDVGSVVGVDKVVDGEDLVTIEINVAGPSQSTPNHPLLHALTPLSGPGTRAGGSACPQQEQGGRGSSKRRAVGGLQGQGRRRQPSGNSIFVFIFMCFYFLSSIFNFIRPVLKNF